MSLNMGTMCNYVVLSLVPPPPPPIPNIIVSVKGQ